MEESHPIQENHRAVLQIFVIFWGHHKNLIHTENRSNYFLVLGKGTSKLAEIQGKLEAIVKAKPIKENIKF